MTRRNVELEVFRFRPDLEEDAIWEAYQVECGEHETVLDALLEVQARVDPSLALRWSCRTGQCGACGMHVNGRPELACCAQLRDLPRTVQVMPLANFEVVRDLIVDIDPLVQSLRAVRPWLARARADARAEAVRHLEPEAGAWSECVQCGLCESACPAVSHVEGFIGPVALAKTWSIERMGSDRESRGRQRVLTGPGGVWDCDEEGQCTQACPLGVNPAAAAAGLKWRLLGRVFRRGRPPEGS